MLERTVIKLKKRLIFNKKFYSIMFAALFTFAVSLYNTDGYTLLLSFFSPNYHNDLVVPAAACSMPKSSARIRIDLNENTMYVYHSDKLIYTFPVSGGAPQTPSPIGKWQIISKNIKNEQSNSSYFNLSVPWHSCGIYGTKETWAVGKNISSDSCILIRDEDMQKLFDTVTCGTEVEISQKETHFRDMKEGCYGSDVLHIQKTLTQLELYHGSLDGVYNQALINAVYDFQKTHALYPTGTINISTYRKIMLLYRNLPKTVYND